MESKGKRQDGMDQMHVAQDTDKWQANVNVVTNLWVP